MAVKLTYLQPHIGDGVVRGSLYQPDGAVGGDLVVLNHGFGSNRIEGLGLFVALARQLCAQGLQVVAFDRPGHGESDGAFSEVTVDREIEHVLAVLDWLSGPAGIDAPAIHLVGMSMGSVLAAAAAASSPVPVASLTLWSPAAVFADELRGGTVQGLPFGDLQTRGYVDFLGLQMSVAYVEAAVRFDPYAAAAGYRGPVRILHGAADPIVPTSYARRYADLYGSAAELTVVDGADHGWSTVPLRAQVIAETGRFLTAHAVGLGA
jgi:hypothetical protein